MRQEIILSQKEIPYRIQLSPDEQDDMCQGKHARLLEILRASGFEVRPIVYDFRWSEQPWLPEDLRPLIEEDEEQHVFLEVLQDSIWLALDATLDSTLESVLLAKSNCQIFTPSRVYSPEESLLILESDQKAECDWQTNSKFYAGLNSWFEQLRGHNIACDA